MRLANLEVTWQRLRRIPTAFEMGGLNTFVTYLMYMGLTILHNKKVKTLKVPLCMP
jgi:hypothetical protein